MASTTSSAARNTVSTTREVALPPSSVHSSRSNSIPMRRPFSRTNDLGAWLTRISTCSSSASSSSHGEALKCLRPRRAITLMSLPPSRFEVRQQSMAVLPTPMISTRSPMRSMCPKATDSSHSMPMWMLAAASLRPGRSRSLPRGAPVPTNTASHRSAPSAASSPFIDETGEL